VKLQWRRYRRWNWGRGGDRVWPFLEGKRGTRRGGSTVPEADDAAKCGMAAGDSKGGYRHLEVEDD
jgi:hypothetical protein